MVSVQPWLGGVSILVSLSLDESESRAGVTIARLPDNRFRDTPLLQQVAWVKPQPGFEILFKLVNDLQPDE